MTGDMTHLLPLGCLGWPRCLTESCRLLLHLNPISLVFPSLYEKDRERQKKEIGEVKLEGFTFPVG